MRLHKLRPARLHQLRGRRRGSAFVEYLVVLACVTIVFIGAMVAIGPQIVEEYQWSRNSLASPYP